MKPCKLQEDGYCIRKEDNYCHYSQCLGCDHHSTSIVVLEASINCETTVIKCDLCNEIITEPKTECR